MQLLVRNKVKDFSTWYAYFKADSDAGAEYGLALRLLWQAAEDPNDVFFLLDIEDIDRANAFMSRPESQDIGVKAGVIDGEFHFLNQVSSRE